MVLLLLAPKRVVQAWRAGAWAGVGSGRREILMSMFSLSSSGCKVADGDAGVGDCDFDCSGMGDWVDILEGIEQVCLCFLDVSLCFNDVYFEVSIYLHGLLDYYLILS